MSQQVLAITLFLSAALAAPAAGCSSAPASPDQVAASVESQLRSVSAVEFYFLSRTDEWRYTPDEVAAKSSIRVYRACGANCHNFMRPVLDHLRAARPIECMPGQEDGLIRAQPGVDIVYSLSGRQIRVADSCYFNDIGIRNIVSGNSMLFSSRQAPADPGSSANNSVGSFPSTRGA